MKRLIGVMIVLALAFVTKGQNLTIDLGQNYTTYNYTNSMGLSNPDIQGGNGYSLAFGIENTVNQRNQLNFGLTMEQFNATGGNATNDYNWETIYIGLQGKYGLKVVDTTSVPFSIFLDLGMNLNHILSGKQKINNATYDLVNEPEFSGFFIKPFVGISLSYMGSNNYGLGISYQLSRNYGLINSGLQKLHFENKTIKFQFIFNLN